MPVRYLLPTDRQAKLVPVFFLTVIGHLEVELLMNRMSEIEAEPKLCAKGALGTGALIILSLGFF
ncbi:Uncharacterised protein [Streptococcus gordonii]|nr:Uncharacterised protein [Streptococcus gordonii]